MPTLANQLAAGEGVFRSVLLIGGWPVEYCDDPTLAMTLPSGRERIEGLDPLTFRVAAKADLARAEIEEQGATVEITDDWQHLVTASFAAVPTARCWITANVAAADTTIHVTSTDGFPSSGVIYMGLETISYTGKTSTSFTGCTRGLWNSPALAHYTGDGENTTAALVTDRPETLIGRRCSVYLFGSADSWTEGTERWRGIIRDAPEFSAGRWSFGVEPRSWVLDQPIGGELVDDLPIRGIYLPALGAFDAQITRLSGANATDGASSDTSRCLLSGFFENQQQWVEGLASVFTTQTSGWSWDGDSELRAEVLGPDRYRIVYRVGSTTPYYLKLRSGGVDDGQLSPVEHVDTDWYAPSEPGVPVTTMLAGGIYFLDVVAPVPRAVLGDFSGGRARWYDWSRPANTPDRIYLGGRVIPTAEMSLSVDSGEDGVDPTPVVSVVSADATDRYVSIGGLLYRFLGPLSRITLLRTLASLGHVGDLIDALIADSPTHATTGTLPLVVSSDFDTDWTELEEAIAGTGWSARVFQAGAEALSLRDLVVPELRAVGCYLAPTSTGALSIRRLRPPLRTDPRAGTLDADAVGAWPAMSLSPNGHLKEVLYRTGWNQLEGEWQGVSIRVRSLAVPSSTGGVLEVAPHSIAPIARGAPEYSIEQAFLMAQGVLGLFGRPYRIVTLGEVSISMMDACQVGSIVVVESDYLPALDGSMGLDQVGLVLGYDWSPYEGRGSVTVLLQELETGGYSPSFLVSTQSGAGTAWTLTLTLSPHTPETDVATWLQAGDEIRLIERDSASPTIVTGTIDSIDSTTDASVTLDSSWTPGASEWICGYDTTVNADETRGARGWAQTDFAMCAGSDRRIALASGDVDAREWAP